MIRTREELTATLATVPDPLGLLVDTNIALPWPESGGLPKLKGFTFIGREGEVLKYWRVVLDEAEPGIRGAVWEVLGTRSFYTWSAPATWAAVRGLCNISPTIVGDVVLASRMVDASIIPTNVVTEMYTVAERLSTEIGSQRAVYELEKQVAGWLMEMSVAGYQWADERVHPLWTTIHPSGSGRIVSKQPSLSNVKKEDRTLFVADDFKRWVCVAWPYADLTMVAALSGDPLLQQAVEAPDPYTVLADIWDTDAERAKQVWQAIATYGLDEQRVAETLKGDITPWGPILRTHAPQWAEWIEKLTRQIPVVTGWLGRRLHVTEAWKVHGAVVMEAVATALKMWLAFLRQEAAFRVYGDMAGFATVIPIYDKVFYQLDVHVPVERHVALMQRIGALSSAGLNFQVEVSMGPTWGNLHRVDHKCGQATADLVTPPTVPVVCPVCQQTAADWPTLEAHLIETHGWTGDEAQRVQ